MVDKLSIKEEMKAIDTKNRNWYDSLTADEKKKVSPWVLMRYVSNVKNDAVSDIEEHYLEWTNELVNVNFNALSKHPQLQVQLMQVVGLGKSQFHVWQAPGKKGGTDSKIHQIFLDLYKHLNFDEVNLLISQYTKDELADILEQNGYKPKDIKKILK